MNDPNSMLPFLLIGDSDLDFTTLFLLSNTMQQDCEHNTDDQMMMYMPLLMGGVSNPFRGYVIAAFDHRL